MILSLLLVFRVAAFVADAEWEDAYALRLRNSEVCSLLRSTEFLARVMPGVLEIRPLTGEEYLYRTERSMPFAGVVRTDFRIRREEWPDGSVVFRTPIGQDANYMLLAFRCATGPDGRVILHARLRVRLSRYDATEIHPLAPLLGEAFISQQMERDLERTLETFAAQLDSALVNQVVSLKEVNP
jgi:hypothetical protein